MAGDSVIQNISLFYLVDIKSSLSFHMLSDKDSTTNDALISSYLISLLFLCHVLLIAHEINSVKAL